MEYLILSLHYQHKLYVSFSRFQTRYPTEMQQIEHSLHQTCETIQQLDPLIFLPTERQSGKIEYDKQYQKNYNNCKEKEPNERPLTSLSNAHLIVQDKIKLRKKP